MPITQLQTYINQAKRIVFFGGAGVSTESGIPDFRSATGIYQQNYHIAPEQFLIHTFFHDQPQAFYQFYRQNLVHQNAQPNVTHYKLAQWEKQGHLQAIVTQNIDGLHQLAGSQTVYELHGSIHRNYCLSCQQFFSLSAVLQASSVPYCSCGGIIKPDVVLYEEMLPEETLQQAITAIAQADLLIIAGTSLKVYPAASLIHHFKGKWLVTINKEPTTADQQATLAIHAALGEVFSALQ